MYRPKNENDYQMVSGMALQLLCIEIRKPKGRHGGMYKICYFCLNFKPTFVDPDSGQRICQDCFGSKHKKHSDAALYTLKDLKDMWEKNF